VLRRFDHVDILVNNAGMIVFGSLMECLQQDWDRMLAVDLTGAFHFTQIIGRAMVERNRGGRLIHVGSTASLFPAPKQAAYSVAKAGLRMLSRQAALELAPFGITSNLLCPMGAVTDINRQLLSDPSVMQALEDAIPAGRMATVEEIAALASFLASDESAYMTGAELVHDGGAAISGLWWR
jgi:glucose 1-dehydrogenase